jgi:hypothetical protein
MTSHFSIKGKNIRHVHDMSFRQYQNLSIEKDPEATVGRGLGSSEEI